MALGTYGNLREPSLNRMWVPRGGGLRKAAPGLRFPGSHLYRCGNRNFRGWAPLPFELYAARIVAEVRIGELLGKGKPGPQPESSIAIEDSLPRGDRHQFRLLPSHRELVLRLLEQGIASRRRILALIQVETGRRRTRPRWMERQGSAAAEGRGETSGRGERTPSERCDARHTFLLRRPWLHQSSPRSAPDGLRRG